MKEHRKKWGQRRRRKVDKIFKTKYEIEENLSSPIEHGPVTSGTRGLEQWQVGLNIYLAIWLEHHGNRLYGFVGLRSKSWMDG